MVNINPKGSAGQIGVTYARHQPEWPEPNHCAWPESLRMIRRQNHGIRFIARIAAGGDQSVTIHTRRCRWNAVCMRMVSARPPNNALQVTPLARPAPWRVFHAWFRAVARLDLQACQRRT
jgi:hypothetical protein